MHTLIAYWHHYRSEQKEVDVTLDQAVAKMKAWAIPITGMTTEQIIFACVMKMRQLDEMNAQFKDGEKADDGIGLIRVGRNLEDRTGSWPPWLFEILSKKLQYDAVNKQFFFKSPSDKRIMEMNGWMFRLKLAPLRSFALKYPMTALRNVFHLKALDAALKMDTKYFNVSAIDQPEKGEDGYYHFRDNSFWEEGAPDD